jgi:hypothetical protein
LIDPRPRKAHLDEVEGLPQPLPFGMRFLEANETPEYAVEIEG